MPVRRRSLRELWRNDTCVWSDSGKKKLPFAGYSVVESAQLSAVSSQGWQLKPGSSLQIVWDDLRSSRADIWHAASEEPQASRIPPDGGSSFPVVIGEGSHPFPFRTRKLSPLPPMVLHAKVCGRVGHCREYFPRPDAKASGLFCLSRAPGSRARASRGSRATSARAGRRSAPPNWRIMSA